MRLLEDLLQARLSASSYPDVGLLARQLSFSPYKQTQLLDLDTNSLLNVEDLSTIVRHLSQIWLEDVQLRIYCWFRSPKGNNPEAFQLISGAERPPLELVAQALAETIRQVASGRLKNRRPSRAKPKNAFQRTRQKAPRR